MMKKILCIVFALLLCLLTACGSKKGGEGSGTTDSSGDQGGAGGSTPTETLSPDDVKGEWAFDWEHGYAVPDIPVKDSVKNKVFHFEGEYEFSSGNGVTVRFEFPNEYCTPNSMLQVRITVTNMTDYALTYVANNRELTFGGKSFIFESDCVPPRESEYYVEGDSIHGTAGSDFYSDPLERGDSVTFERIYWVSSTDFEALEASGATSAQLSFNFRVLVNTEFSYTATIDIPVQTVS